MPAILCDNGQKKKLSGAKDSVIFCLNGYALSLYNNPNVDINTPNYLNNHLKDALSV